MKEGERIESADSGRVQLNVMRHHYKVLNEFEKDCMIKIKDQGLAFHELCAEIGLTTGDPQRPPGSRELALAQTKIEEAVMWAVKHITK